MGTLIAADFNGTTESLFIADNASLSMGDIDFTIAVWVYADILDSGVNRVILSKWQPSVEQEYSLQWNSSGIGGGAGWKFFIDSAGNDTGKTVIFRPATANQWQFVVIWHDATANTINIQVDNGTVNSAAHTGGAFDGTRNFRIGAHSDGANSLDGRAAMAGVWKNRVLSASDRTSLYNAGCGKSFSELTAGEKTDLESYWDLDEVAGTRFDLQGSNDLGLTGTPDTADAPCPTIPVCWNATAMVGEKPWSDSGSGPCPAVIRVPKGATDIIITDDGMPVNPRIVEG